jgi:hypothetical protein
LALESINVDGNAQAIAPTSSPTFNNIRVPPSSEMQSPVFFITFCIPLIEVDVDMDDDDDDDAEDAEDAEDEDDEDDEDEDEDEDEDDVDDKNESFSFSIFSSPFAIW